MTIEKLWFFLKKVLKSFFRDPHNFFFLISRQTKMFVEYPIFYAKDYLNVISSFTISLLLNLPIREKIRRKINGLWIELDYNLDYRLTSMFLGSYDLEVACVLFKYLKKKNTFIDVGSSIGYFSAIGAGLVGKKGQVHSFEPVPMYFNKSLNMVNMNKKYQIFVNNFALGESTEKKIMEIPKDNIGHNSIVPGLLKKSEIKKKINIKVKRLDDYIFEKKLKNISLIKIDVEGFEFFVLKGLTHYFEQYKNKLPPIIVEITPSAYKLLNISLKDLEILMKNHNYKAYTHDGKKKIDIKKVNKLCNVLFLPYDLPN